LCGCVADDGLLLCNPTDTLRLHRLISDAVGCANGRACPPGGNLKLLLHGQALHIQVIPLARNQPEQPWSLGLSISCVAVFITIPGNSAIRNQKLKSLYGLSPAESRLAVLLTEGVDLDTAAQRLSVSIQTVRCQLKAIFAKTNVSRQAELVALLFSNLLLESPVD